MSLDRVRDLCAAAAGCHDEGRIASGLALVREAVTLARGSLGEDHYAYPLALCALGWMTDAAGDDATALFDEAAERAEDFAAEDFEHAHAVLAHVRDWRQGHADARRALATQRRIVALHASSLGDDHPRYFAAKARLGAMAATAGESC